MGSSLIPAGGILINREAALQPSRIRVRAPQGFQDVILPHFVGAELSRLGFGSSSRGGPSFGDFDFEGDINDLLEVLARFGFPQPSSIGPVIPVRPAAAAGGLDLQALLTPGPPQPSSIGPVKPVRHKAATGPVEPVKPTAAAGGLDLQALLTPVLPSSRVQVEVPLPVDFPSDRPLPPGDRPLPPGDRPLPPDGRPLLPGGAVLLPGGGVLLPGGGVLPSGGEVLPPGVGPLPPGSGALPPSGRPSPPSGRPLPPSGRPLPPGSGALSPGVGLLPPSVGPLLPDIGPLLSGIGGTPQRSPLEIRLEDFFSFPSITPGNIDPFLGALSGLRIGAPALDVGNVALERLLNLPPSPVNQALDFIINRGLPGQQVLSETVLPNLLTLAISPVQNVQTALDFILNQGLPGQLGVQTAIPRGLAQQGRFTPQAGAMFEAISRGGVPATAELARSVQGLLTQPLAGIIPQIRTPQITPPGSLRALEQGVSRPEFFENLVARAFGAGQGLTTPQAPRVSLPRIDVSGIQQAAERTLQDALGGLTSDFVAAQRRRILEPAMEALEARLNRQGGGVADLGSGIFEEQRGRLERSFADTLAALAFERLPQLVGLGAQLGQQAFQQQLAPALAQAELAQQANLANLQAQLQTQQLGTEAGLRGLGLLPELSAQDLQRQIAIQQQLAGLETGIAQQQADLALRAALANAAALQQGGQFDIETRLRQQALGAQGQQQLFGQALAAAQALGQQGQQGFANALAAFQAVPQQVFPFLQLSSDVGNQRIAQALETFRSIPQAVFPFLQLAGQQQELAQRGLQQAATLGAQRLRDIGGFFQGNLGLAMQLLAQQQARELGQAEIQAGILRTILSGQSQERVAAAGRPGFLESLIPTLIPLIPDLIGRLRGGIPGLDIPVQFPRTPPIFPPLPPGTPPFIPGGGFLGPPPSPYGPPFVFLP